MGRVEGLRTELMAAVDDTITALHTHGSDPAVAQQGLAFLMGLSGTVAHQATLIHAVDVAAAVLSQHVATLTVVDYGLGFLMNESIQHSNAVRTWLSRLSVRLYSIPRLCVS